MSDLEKKEDKQTQITRSDVQSRMLNTLDLLERRVNNAELCTTKDIALFVKMLSDMGAMDDIIASENEKVMDITKRNFKIVFDGSKSEEERKLGM